MPAANSMHKPLLAESLPRFKIDERYYCRQAGMLNDWAWSCYLADLAISQDKKAGIGKKLINLTKMKVGDESIVLLLSVPTSMEYYPKVGMEKIENGFIINRTK